LGIRIDTEGCIGCALCEYSCAYDAIEVHLKAQVNNDQCTDCGVCLDYCPVDVISFLDGAAPPPRRPRSAPGSFDVVVIGAGIGGLSAGALLAHRGYNTLVIERSPSVGGRYGSLKHGNIVYPNGGSLIQVGGPVEEVFEEVGAEFDVVNPGRFKYWVKGKGWIDPGEGGGQFRRALIMVSEDEEAVSRVLGSLRDVLQSQQYPDGTMLDWLSSLSDNAGIKGIFQAIVATAFGPEDVPAKNFFALLALTSGKGAGLAHYGGIRLMQTLAKSIVRNGGQVWNRTKARRIVMDGDKVAGVEVSRPDGDFTIPARVVVSNSGPFQTIDLAGSDNFGPSYLAHVEDRIKPMYAPSFHIVGTKSLLGEGYAGFAYMIGSRRICTMFDATAIAGWSPDGVRITEAYPFVVPDPDIHPDPALWVAEAEQDLDEISPGWREHSRLRTICFDREYPGNHTWTGLGVDVETPIANLFLVGDGCESPKGYAGGSGAAESAQRAVGVIEERFPVAARA
jgi:phytoene dehydrogenase-like protein/NAD-dependent dihydropyrimidine dehydrogenase PreA subunit